MWSACPVPESARLRLCLWWKALRGLERPRGLLRAIDGDLPGDVDHRGEHLERQRGDRLEDLLVVPARLACLLMQVHRGSAAVLEQRLAVAQQGRFTRVTGVEVTRLRDLIEVEARCTRGARVRRDARLGVVVLGHR